MSYLKQNGKITGWKEDRNLKDLMKRTASNGEYPRISYNGKTIAIHKIIYNFVFNGCPKENHIHHIDGNRSNNYFMNLKAFKRSEHSKTHN